MLALVQGRQPVRGVPGEQLHGGVRGVRAHVHLLGLRSAHGQMPAVPLAHARDQGVPAVESHADGPWRAAQGTSKGQRQLDLMSFLEGLWAQHASGAHNAVCTVNMHVEHACALGHEPSVPLYYIVGAPDIPDLCDRVHGWAWIEMIFSEVETCYKSAANQLCPSLPMPWTDLKPVVHHDGPRIIGALNTLTAQQSLVVLVVVSGRLRRRRRRLVLRHRLVGVVLLRHRK